ncbi:hypothetical protein DVH24_032807 [Malus domestica]|uniref:ADF-H domain-containing protein n=1 Tax=Malus domestica TaxID=3750 RepID=A0A498IT83_MALDO|nr:hypothetical protein DVH24_032807 [Malus domestica]
MIYASYKNMLKGELDGVQVELQVTDRAEIALDVIKRHLLIEAELYKHGRKAISNAKQFITS